MTLKERIYEDSKKITAFVQDRDEAFAMSNDCAVDEIRKAMRELVEVINGIDSKLVTKGIFEGILQSHRYLQSEFWMAFHKAMEQYAVTEYKDGRNEWAVDAVGRMVKAYNDF